MNSSKKKSFSKIADTVGNYFRGKLDELQQKYPVIGDVRGKGLMLALELVKDRTDQGARAGSDRQLLERTREHGLLIGKGGLYGNVIRLSPMLNIGKADVDEAVRVLDKSLSHLNRVTGS